MIPNQSMTLREIIKRFVRKESLPISKEGHYEDRYGDLEKMSKQDITTQMEMAEVLKEKIDKGRKASEARKKADQEAAQEKALEEKLAKKLAEKEAASKSEPIVPGVGGAPLKSPAL